MGECLVDEMLPIRLHRICVIRKSLTRKWRLILSLLLSFTFLAIILYVRHRISLQQQQTLVIDSFRTLERLQEEINEIEQINRDVHNDIDFLSAKIDHYKKPVHQQ